MAGWIVRPDIGALPNGLAGMPYVGFTFDNYIGFSPNYTGGQPYSYAIVAGSLPPGLTFNKPPGIYSNIGDPDTTLILGGTPTAGVASGNYSFSVLWTNGNEGRTQLSNYTIFISPSPSVGTCESQLINGVNFALGDPPGTLQYFIGATTITSALSISNASTIGSIQASIDSDPTYLASGTTITILTGLPSVTALIAKNSTEQISNMAVGRFIGNSSASTDSEPFICNIVTRKSSSGAPSVICLDPKDYSGICPPYIFKYNSWYLFIYINEQKKCCYKRIR